MSYFIRTIFVITLLCSISALSAEKLTIYIAESRMKELSVEMTLGARLDLDEGQENIGIIIHSLGKKVATVEVSFEEGDLASKYEASKDKNKDDPFFCACDSYIIKDSRGRWFLTHYEYNPGERYRFCPLKPILNEKTLFFANGLLQSSYGSLNAEFARITNLPANLERRKRRTKK